LINPKGLIAKRDILKTVLIVQNDCKKLDCGKFRNQ